MIKHITALLLFIGFAWGQSEEIIINLLNGELIKGDVIEVVPNQYIVVRTEGGEQKRISYAHIDYILHNAGLANVIQAAAVKAAKEARENAKRKKEEYAARKVAEEAAAEFVDLPEVSALSGWNIGIAPSIGFLTGAAFSNAPLGVTIVINTPYGFIMGPFHFNFSAALGRYLGTYDSAVDGLLNEEHFITVLGIGGNLTLLKIFFTEVHVGTVGAGHGVRGFGGVSLASLMKKRLNLPLKNVLVGGEVFISSDMRGAGNPSG